MIHYTKRMGSYLNETDAAAYLTYSPGTLRTIRCKGAGPTFLKLGRRVVYRLEDLERYLRERAVVKSRTSDDGRPFCRR